MSQAKQIIASHISTAITRALRGESRLDPEVLKINGFATPTMRHLFNNLCRFPFEGATYLEIGTFCGATFVSAFNNNPITAIGVDDFSQSFEQTGVEDQLHANVAKFKDTAKEVRFYNENCFNLNGLSVKPPVDIYYYDGEHSYDNQARALPAFYESLADRFIHLVDDFHWDDVRRGTRDGLKVLEGKIKVEQEWNLMGDRANDDPIWWNGLAIYLISKVK